MRKTHIRDWSRATLRTEKGTQYVTMCGQKRMDGGPTVSPDEATCRNCKVVAGQREAAKVKAATKTYDILYVVPGGIPEGHFSGTRTAMSPEEACRDFVAVAVRHGVPEGEAKAQYVARPWTESAYLKPNRR